MKKSRTATIHEKLAKALSESGAKDNQTYTTDEIKKFYIQTHGDRDVKKRSMLPSDHCDKLTDGSASGTSRCRVCESGDYLLIRVSNDGEFRVRPRIVGSGAIPIILAPSAASQSTQIEDFAREYEEGKRQLRQHRVLERNRKLIAVKKSNFLELHGRLFCEVCSFDFASFYGPVGEGYAECHHITPLAQTEGVRKNRVKDLAVVCSNCHRMLHRQPFFTVDELRAEVDLRRKS